MCKKCFKTLYSVKKHIGEKHQGEEGTITPRFKDCKGFITPLPKPRSVLDPGSVEGYKMWLAGLIERLNSTFHPRLPGKFILFPLKVALSQPLHLLPPPKKNPQTNEITNNEIETIEDSA